MGSASSKTARKLPTRPSWAGSHTPSATTTEPVRPAKGPLAFESRNTIVEDAKDPQLMEKLNRLGPVPVDHRMRTVQAASDVRDMYRSRVRSETEAATASVQFTRDRVLASSLAELLEARKSVTSRAELDTLAQRYHMDVLTLQRLGRVVNTPSIDEGTVVRSTDDHGDESLMMSAHWIDPALSRV